MKTTRLKIHEEKLVKSNEKEKKIKTEVLLPRNGQHSAKGKIQGILMAKPKNEFVMILDDLTIPARLTPRLLNYYKNNKQVFNGKKNYIVYPKVNQNMELTSVTVCVIQQAKGNYNKEKWIIKGIWDEDAKTFLVQRQYRPNKPIYSIKYPLKEVDLKNQKFYSILLQRENDKLVFSSIQKKKPKCSSIQI